MAGKRSTGPRDKEYAIYKVHRPNLLWEFKAFRVHEDGSVKLPPKLTTEYVTKISAVGPAEAVDLYYFEHMNVSYDLWQ